MESTREIRKRLGAIDLVPSEDSIRLLSEALEVALSEIELLQIEIRNLRVLIVNPMANEKRYFVDGRVGCIAVRDRNATNPDYPGLHANTEGVVRYWKGEWDGNYWRNKSEDVAAAYALCRKLNGEPELSKEARDAEDRPPTDAVRHAQESGKDEVAGSRSEAAISTV